MAEVVYGPIFRLTAATLTIKTSLKTLFLPKDLVISEKSTNFAGKFEKTNDNESETIRQMGWWQDTTH